MSIENVGVDYARALTWVAQGPIATVYAARSAGGGAEAVKVFPERFDRDTAAWLDRERKALDATRSTPSLLPIEGLVEFPQGRSGVRMRLCDGSLAGLLDAGVRLPVSDVLRLGAAVASALAAAHRVDVLHGGVTPHNVLYRASGEFFLADFGQALRRRFPRDPMYAVEYTAPETLRDDTLSTASDLYGLGAVLYTVLTGAPPFPRRTGQQPGERILQVLREPVAPIRGAGVPAGLSEMVIRLLAKEPDDRPHEASAVAELFENLRRSPESRGVPAPVQESPDRAEAAAEPEASDDEPEQEHVEFDDFAELPRAGAPAVPPVPSPSPSSSVSPTSPTSPSSPAEPVVRPPAPANPGGRTLIRTFGGPAAATRNSASGNGWRTGILVGAGVVVVGLAVVPMLAGPEKVSGQASPITLAAQPANGMPPGEAAPDMHLELAQPADLGDRVRLSWRADGDLDFAVVVAGERIDTMVLVAHRQRAMDVPVDPARRYCFQIRATDGRHVYTSTPVPIRGGHCTP
ncbi:serine/threonine protein kinase [Amycolatopsis sp. NPDC059021]|uniref:serine/threonine protein kinase n=1 Tax=Amycolatopsis sp. NPDC059021 TaxID=3346704 RepID=UPI0036724DB3